ncbi:DUF1800 domain-containing protein [Thermoleophilia bacterium SCSIO 60948]|nr:DUF1800 domain-containing protein [Thermoleophilia bacterium SCSIO 60948]
MPSYAGPFGRAQAERLIWRAGFGPKPGQLDRLAAKGMRGAVLSLTRPSGEAKLSGPRPVDSDGNPLAPKDVWGHDHVWWLDRMVRSSQSLVERMALNWHDWFATGDQAPKMMIAQSNLFRAKALGPFDGLLLGVTKDKAMLAWLSGLWNTRWEPNENYARELMELFTLGVSDGSGYPYSEDDVRELARALTGWQADWSDGIGLHNYRYEREAHDGGSKTVFGRTGRFDWKDACRLCLEHEAHAPFLVDKLWSYFIPEPPDAATRDGLVAIYRNGYRIRPLVEAILQHPRFYEGPRLVKPPVVHTAGLLRARDLPVRTDAWHWINELGGQRLFRPPNVAGWDEERWLDTSTFRGRWFAANEIARRDVIDWDEGYPKTETAAEGVDKALRYWGDPSLSSGGRAVLEQYARRVESMAVEDWQRSAFRATRQNALRMLIATSPDMQAI